MKRGLAFVVVVALAVLAWAAPAMARPGGGSGFHGSTGGSHPAPAYHPPPSYHPSTPSYHPSTPTYHPSSSDPSPTSGGGGAPSDGGGGGGGFAGLLILAFLGAFVVIPIMLASSRSGRQPQAWSSGPVAASATVVGARRALEAIRAHDPAFSLVLFEDFLYALYAEVHLARGRGQVALFSAYLAPNVVQELSAAQGGGVRDVVVGALRFLPAGGDPSRDLALAEIEANYTEQGQSFYVRERWWLSRAAGARSRPPERARVFTCPSCGAPQDAVIAGTCSYCKQTVATGAFDWVVQGIRVEERNATPPILTGDAPEVGTELPTRVDPSLGAAMAALQAKDPSFDWTGFTRRVGLVFAEFQTAWAARDLARMRPFMTDALFEIETYWVKTYLSQGLRNVTENARILRLDPARVASDAYYDAITVRLFATSLDYTLRDADGAVVGGSRSKERVYSEYWTFVRGAERRGPAGAEARCPSCGAALKVTMAGTCEYCQAHVTRGEFDWVLSRIEQDEAYEG